MTRRLFVAAGPRLLASLAEPLEALGYELNGIGADEALSPPWPKAALLDGEFRDAPGLARRLRGEGFSGTLVTIGFDAPEADATLTRPFRVGDLLACLDSGARREAPESPDPHLTEKEAAILARLAQARGAIISKTALLADVWGYGPNVSTRTLETHIYRLRRKIEADPNHPLKLLTEDGGYRLASAAKEIPHKSNSP